ncbi:hypothetical protein J4G53_22435 [Serratia ureilytica]|uniref:hypothetical protein n=1 Tax=Serratia ureilytica TaxID=300181 RepID=UPI001AA16C35|nr:hypothetical protein [Serratia ureilytica]MBO1811012.1 hypothetical protein [Serratia ureilytica]
MKEKNVLERFKCDTRNHSMSVDNDNGVFRHLHFSRGGSSCYHFTLTSWPGHLCISGDMGTYVFSRLYDMFDFFCMDKYDFIRNEGELSINPGYWSEKLQHGGRGYCREVYTEWSPEAFEARAQEYLDDWLEYAADDFDDEEAFEEAKEEAVEAIEELKLASGYEYEAVTAVHDFSCKHIDLTDFFEASCREASNGYIWCLYAIVRGIQQYDISKLAGSAIDKFFVYTLDKY